MHRRKGVEYTTHDQQANKYLTHKYSPHHRQQKLQSTQTPQTPRRPPQSPSAGSTHDPVIPTGRTSGSTTGCVMLFSTEAIEHTVPGQEVHIHSQQCLRLQINYVSGENTASLK